MKKNSTKKNTRRKKAAPKKSRADAGAAETGRKGALIRKIFIFMAAAAVIAGIYGVVDYYTGWGDAGKVIERKIKQAEESAVYKNYSKAARIYEDILEKWGGAEEYSGAMWQVKLNLAGAYKDSGEYISAIKLYRELAEKYRNVNPDMYAWVMLELGDAYNRIYNTGDAVKVYGEITERFEGTDWAAEALFGLAETHKTAGNNKEAVKFYDIIIKKYRKGFLAAEAMTSKAEIYEKKGMYDRALEIYSKVINDFPEIVTEYARYRHGVLSDKKTK